MTQKSAYAFIKESYCHWSDHRASRMGAALSYYTIFSIIPLLSLIVIIAGVSLGHAYIENELSRQIGAFIGPESGKFIRSLLEASLSAGTGIWVSIVSFVVLAVGTLGMLRELKNSMDDLWDAPSGSVDARWWKSYIAVRLISLSLIPVLVFLLIISMVASSLLAFAGTDATFLLKLGTTGFGVVVTSLLFMFIYRYIPARKLPWNEIFWGAVATAFLFLAGKALIGLYLSRFAGVSVFGAAGAFIVILLWIYYSMEIFFFGASMTYVWSRKYGHLKGAA